MRSVIVNSVRERIAQKRGGDWSPMTLSTQLAANLAEDEVWLGAPRCATHDTGGRPLPPNPSQLYRTNLTTGRCQAILSNWGLTRFGPSADSKHKKKNEECKIREQGEEQPSQDAGAAHYDRIVQI
jgi:hypothetical protein